MIDRSRPTLGANDNLSGVMVALGVAKYISEKGRPKNTEIWCVSFGSEEGGLHGSKAFVKKHRDELGNVILINLDSVGYGEIRIVKKEMMTRHNNQVVDLIEKAATNSGIPHSIMGSGGGRTDAMSFTEKGFLASTLIAIKKGQKMPDNYHTDRDTPENLDPTVMKTALQLCIGIINLIESGVIKIKR